VLLQQLLHQAGEANVATVILADATDGTYIPRSSPAPSAAPSKKP
jgi:streptomycin 6-kinase